MALGKSREVRVFGGALWRATSRSWCDPRQCCIDQRLWVSFFGMWGESGWADRAPQARP